MKTNKKLTLALLLSITASGYADSDDNSMTFGEGVTAPGAFALNIGADVATLGQTHQTRNYIDRNRNGGENASSENLTFGEAAMTPASGTLNIFSGQTHQQGRRNFHSSDEQRKETRRSARRNRNSDSTQSSSHHCHNPFRDRGTECRCHNNNGHWYHHHSDSSVDERGE